MRCRGVGVVVWGGGPANEKILTSQKRSKERISGMTGRVQWLGLYFAYKGVCFIIFH